MKTRDTVATTDEDELDGLGVEPGVGAVLEPVLTSMLSFWPKLQCLLKVQMK